MARERENIIRNYIFKMGRVFNRYKTNIGPAPCSILMHKFGILLPLVDSRFSSSWLFRNYDDLILEIIQKFTNKIDKVTSVQSMMFFWGMGRLGVDCLGLPINTNEFKIGKDVYDELLQKILKNGVFHGNNICNAIESLSRMRYGQNDEAFEIILKNAKNEFSKGETSPHNISYFLESIVASRYEIDNSIIESAIEVIAKNLELKDKSIHMHFIIKVLDAALYLRPSNINIVINALDNHIKTNDALVQKQPIWNHDLVSLIKILDSFSFVDKNSKKNIINYCIKMSENRMKRFRYNQEILINEAFKNLNCDVDVRVQKEPSFNVFVKEF